MEEGNIFVTLTEDIVEEEVTVGWVEVWLRRKKWRMVDEIVEGSSRRRKRSEHFHGGNDFWLRKKAVKIHVGR